MRYLLDTHTILWTLHDVGSLSETSLQLISDARNEVLVSTASLWEIAIKVSLKRLEIDFSFEKDLQGALSSQGIPILDITLPHLSHLSVLPFIHRDPFDRMLVAQAQAEGIPLISKDGVLDAYAITRIW